MAPQRILVVDDEEKIIHIIRAYLERDGYRVVQASDGRAALELARHETPDLIVLDLMLPEVSGWDVCRTLRRESDVPIIMLTARDEDTDKVLGLELGADDYLTKPFNPSELVSRVRAVLRRPRGGPVETGSRLEFPGLTIDRERHEVRRNDRPLELTPTEFNLLVALASTPGRVYSRAQLLDRVQGEVYEGYERTVDSHIKNLRKKIESDPDRPGYILTVRGVGYKFSDDSNA